MVDCPRWRGRGIGPLTYMSRAPRMLFRDPAVASGRCAISPESDIPELRMRSRRTLERKSDGLSMFRFPPSLVAFERLLADTHPRRYKAHKE